MTWGTDAMAADRRASADVASTKLSPRARPGLATDLLLRAYRRRAWGKAPMPAVASEPDLTREDDESVPRPSTVTRPRSGASRGRI